MKNRVKIIFSLAVFSLISLGAFAQNYGSNYDYEYNDDVVIVNDYNDDYYRTDRRRDRRDYRRDRKRRSNSYVRQERRWKASILDRAYAIAAADGRITRREKREIRRLENDLGIYRLDQNRRRVCR